MLASNRPRDTPAGLIETMCFETGRANDVPTENIGSIDPSCLKKRPPKGRNKIESGAEIAP